jgi:hypothetical protein
MGVIRAKDHLGLRLVVQSVVGGLIRYAIYYGTGLRNRIVGKDGFTLSTHHFEKVDGQEKRMIHYA